MLEDSNDPWDTCLSASPGLGQPVGGPQAVVAAFAQLVGCAGNPSALLAIAPRSRLHRLTSCLLCSPRWGRHDMDAVLVEAPSDSPHELAEPGEAVRG